MEESFIEVNGIRVRYVEKGSGKNVILVHGLGGSLESWRNNLEHLSSMFRVVALDLPGFGFSDKPDVEYTPWFYADFLPKFLSRLGIRKACLVGHSMGGLVALATSIRHPEIVEKLVLVDAAGLDDWTAKVVREAMGEWWNMERLKRFYEEYVGKPDEKILELRLKLYEDEGLRRAYLSALKALEKTISPEEVSKVSAPTLIIWGEGDRLTRPEGGVKLKSTIKGSRLVVFKDVSHTPHADKPEEFNKLVSEFLKDP